MPASNSDGLLANPAFMRAVEAARAQARLPGGVKQLAPLCLSQLSTEKLYEGDWLAVIPPPTMKQ